MSYEQAIDVKTIYSWLKGEHGAVSAIAKKLQVSKSWVNQVLSNPEKRNNDIIEEALNVVEARQQRLIRLMTRINENNLTIKRLVESTKAIESKTLHQNTNEPTNENRAQV